MDISKLRLHTKNLHILYAEDSLTLRKTTEKKLSKLFKRVDVAENGKDAFKLYEKHYKENKRFYDIVLTDLEMPIMDGTELSKKIFDFNDSQEIIVISGIGDFSKLIELMNLGVKKFIQKPIEDTLFNELISDVAQSIRAKKLAKDEKNELELHNSVLKKREDVYLNKLKEKINELEEFKDALDISAIVAKTDLKGAITYVNDKFCKISGYSKEEIIGKNHSILNSGKLSRSYFKRLWNTINAKKNYKSMFINISKDKRTYYLNTTIKPIINTNGDIVEFIAVSFDITQEMNALEEVQKAQKSKENFFINISHEMKTPLNSILGFSHLLINRVKDDEKSLMLLNTLKKSAEDLEYLISSVLDISKMKDNKLTLDETYFCPNDVITTVFERYKTKALEKNQSLKNEIISEIPSSLFGDSKMIIQILSVILDNAIKFTNNNGKITQYIEYDNIDKKLIFKIQDNGIGIAKKDQEEIFNYGQIDGSHTRSHEGAGFGLSLASGLVKLLKGKISVKSIPKKGSIFKIVLPIKDNN